MSIKRILTALSMITTAATWANDAAASVRFGKNVFIGGHNVSGQTFDKKHRGAFYIYNGTPRHPGCRLVKHADGSRTKICHWKKLSR